MRSYGCIKSTLLGNENKAELITPRIELPKKYSLRNMAPIRDQGDVPKCMSVALTDLVYWKLKTAGVQPDIADDVFWINRFDKIHKGMSAKEAFQLLVDYHITKYNFSLYALVSNIETAKRCILCNGPVVACLPVRSYMDDFWIGNENLGGHAVLLTGYDKNGFELRNSWGTSYGNFGYNQFPYSEFNKGFEYWTLIK